MKPGHEMSWSGYFVPGVRNILVELSGYFVPRGMEYPQVFVLSCTCNF